MNTNEVLHEFRQGPIKVSILAPHGAKLVIQFRFEFVRVEENGSESKSFCVFRRFSDSDPILVGQ